MAREVRAFQVTIPAGTAQAAPATFSIKMDPRIVRQIEWMVPPGPRGNVGFQIAMAGRQLIPYNPGAFLVADGETQSWPMEELPSSGAWQVIAYNSGQKPHTIYFRFLVDLTGGPSAVVLPMLSGADLSQGADQVLDVAAAS